MSSICRACDSSPRCVASLTQKRLRVRDNRIQPRPLLLLALDRDRLAVLGQQHPQTAIGGLHHTLRPKVPARALRPLVRQKLIAVAMSSLIVLMRDHRLNQLLRRARHSLCLRHHSAQQSKANQSGRSHQSSSSFAVSECLCGIPVRMQNSAACRKKSCLW